MNKAGQDCRAIDTNSVKERITTYMVPSMEAEDINPPLSADDKASRGFFHPQTARLLCPAKYLAEFDCDVDEYVCHILSA